MAYNATYTADDTSAVVIDKGTAVLVAIGSFAAIIGLVMVYRYFKTGKLF